MNLEDVQIENLPTWLFKSHVDYYLLYFLKQGGAGRFYAASRSLERCFKCTKSCVMGYTDVTRGYRSYTASCNNSLWWKPRPRFNEGNSKSALPFTLTSRGHNRAHGVWKRVDEFLHSLVDDLVIETLKPCEPYFCVNDEISVGIKPDNVWDIKVQECVFLVPADLEAAFGKPMTQFENTPARWTFLNSSGDYFEVCMWKGTYDSTCTHITEFNILAKRSLEVKEFYDWLCETIPKGQRRL